METYHQAKECKARGTSGTPLSARTAAWLFVCNPRKLKLRQCWQLEPLRLGDEELAQANQLVQDFRTMVTQRQGPFSDAGSKKHKRAAFLNEAAWQLGSIAIMMRCMAHLKLPTVMDRQRLRSIGSN